MYAFKRALQAFKRFARLQNILLHSGKDDGGGDDLESKENSFAYRLLAVSRSNRLNLQTCPKSIKFNNDPVAFPEWQQLAAITTRSKIPI